MHDNEQAKKQEPNSKIFQAAKHQLANWKLRVLQSFNKIQYIGVQIPTLDEGSELLCQVVQGEQPVAVGKVGSLELEAVRVYSASNDPHHHDKKWAIISPLLYNNVGIFPPNSHTFQRFCETYNQAANSLDIVGIWYNRGERAFLQKNSTYAKMVPIRSLEPYYAAMPWTAALAGKRVLVVHPFASSIYSQYARRADIWKMNPGVLPNFELKVLRAPLSHAIQPSGFENWLEALKWMKNQMSLIDFDVALIGAGGYSIPLAAHAKSIGRIGIHLGGATQVLFGIRGRRWDEHPEIRKFYNDSWIRPTPEETPSRSLLIESGCYW